MSATGSLDLFQGSFAKNPQSAVVVPFTSSILNPTSATGVGDASNGRCDALGISVGSAWSNVTITLFFQSTNNGPFSVTWEDAAPRRAADQSFSLFATNGSGAVGVVTVTAAADGTVSVSGLELNYAGGVRTLSFSCSANL